MGEAATVPLGRFSDPLNTAVYVTSEISGAAAAQTHPAAEPLKRPLSSRSQDDDDEIAVIPRRRERPGQESVKTGEVTAIHHSDHLAIQNVERRRIVSSRLGSITHRWVPICVMVIDVGLDDQDFACSMCDFAQRRDRIVQVVENPKKQHDIEFTKVRQ